MVTRLHRIPRRHGTGATNDESPSSQARGRPRRGSSPGPVSHAAKSGNKLEENMGKRLRSGQPEVWQGFGDKLAECSSDNLSGNVSTAFCQQSAQMGATASRFRVVRLDFEKEVFRRGRWLCTDWYERDNNPQGHGEATPVTVVTGLKQDILEQPPATAGLKQDIPEQPPATSVFIRRRSLDVQTGLDVLDHATADQLVGGISNPVNGKPIVVDGSTVLSAVPAALLVTNSIRRASEGQLVRSRRATVGAGTQNLVPNRENKPVANNSITPAIAVQPPCPVTLSQNAAAFASPLRLDTLTTVPATPPMQSRVNAEPGIPMPLPLALAQTVGCPSPTTRNFSNHDSFRDHRNFASSALPPGCFSLEGADAMANKLFPHLFSSSAVRGGLIPTASDLGMEADGMVGSGVVAIANKIEQAMDLVKSHLMFAVREEVEVLKEQIRELVEKNSHLEQENQILKNLANPEQLAHLNDSAAETAVQGNATSTAPPS
uniref:TSC22 domain family protein 4-like isoform X2 n=1 Tax=Myxine glutinosa TaxID=7769 RepID=UPI00358E41A0